MSILSRKAPEPLEGHVEGRINIGMKSGAEDKSIFRLLWAASRGQRCPSVIRLPHRDTFSCEPGISDEQILHMGNVFSWALMLSQLQLHLTRLLENVCWNSEFWLQIRLLLRINLLFSMSFFRPTNELRDICAGYMNSAKSQGKVENKVMLALNNKLLIHVHLLGEIYHCSNSVHHNRASRWEKQCFPGTGGKKHHRKMADGWRHCQGDAALLKFYRGSVLLYWQRSKVTDCMNETDIFIYNYL